MHFQWKSMVWEILKGLKECDVSGLLKWYYKEFFYTKISVIWAVQIFLVGLLFWADEHFVIT